MAKETSHMRKKIRTRLIFVGLVAVLGLAFIFPTQLNKAIDGVNNTVALGIPRLPEQGFLLGLDLQGGAHLMYQADVSNIPTDNQGEAVDGVRDVIERRINALGVSESNIQVAKVGNDYRLNIEMPGIDDVSTAINLIGETPILAFKEENLDPPRTLTAEEAEQIETYNNEMSERALAAKTALEAGTDMASVASEYSQDPSSKDNGGSFGFINKNTQYGPEVYNWASTHTDGDISDVIETSYGYFTLVRGVEQEGEPEVSASHILICYLGATQCNEPKYTKEEALAKAQEIFDMANADNFADLAAEHSTDLANKDNGGDLGAFTRSMMVPAFSDAAFNANVGEIIAPVETDFGYHVIYKTDEGILPEYDVSGVFIAKLQERDILGPQDEWKNTGLSGKQLDRAEVVTDSQTGSVQVSLQFDQEGKELFSELTEKNIGKPIAIFLDGNPISVPTVQSVITGGQAVITGDFTITEARELSQRLNTGALPVPIELISQQSIGATLGAESLAKGLTAGIIGIILVMIFMVGYYRLPGVLSVLSLSIYIIFTLAIFKLIHVTLTLAGIAGFILSIGMAVDANVLIFERLKEELQDGKSLKAAVEEGFIRAWTSIRDGNASTLITCLLLIWFGSSFVQGFAATLAIGILLSMFTAITITRFMLRYVVPWFPSHGNKLFLGYSSKKEQ
ncbi:protein translocase subunit SecD [Patescibacteria group bacterium]|nr:protein translocase subunit SecD [Patescibacteria group bacterium]MBU1721779.1 protein translocase subunit SecD [Patescibacteria group bacterium]MBU1901382.1 protein translocase subunit SecD [Patescibacteria group bacterium]